MSAKLLFPILAGACLALSAGLTAQSAGTPALANPLAAQADVPQLKVQLVISRSRPGTDTSNLPFEMMVQADGRTDTTVNVGVDVPVPTGGSGFQYRRVGNNIQCSGSFQSGLVTLDVDIEDSSIHDGSTGEAGPRAYGGAPMFRSFRTTARLTMKEGEPMGFTLATDKQTGETLRVSVTASRAR